MHKKATEDKAITDFRAVLTKERDAKRTIVDSAEAKLPALKAAVDERNRELEAHVDAHRRTVNFGSSATEAERDELTRVRQVAYDALSNCERELQQVKPRLAEIERLLGADAAVEELTQRIEGARSAAAEAETNSKVADEMLAAIDSEKAARATRRQDVADANVAAGAEHARAAIAARKEGKPVPPAPTLKHPATADQTDADLDSQRSAVVRMQAKHADELKAAIDEITAARQQLLRARFDAADFRVQAGLHGMKEAITECEAARLLLGGYGGPGMSLSIDAVAVQRRIREIEEEIPRWAPMAKRDNQAKADQLETTATTDAPSEAAA